MTRFDNSDDAARFDPLALSQALRGRLGVGAEVAERLRGVRGSASSADGNLTVEVDVHGRLAGITLDPRAMRLPSVELADALVTLSREANDDLARRIAELVGDPRQLVAAFDAEKITQQLTDISDDFGRMSTMGRDQFEELQRRLRSPR